MKSPLPCLPLALGLLALVPLAAKADTPAPLDPFATVHFLEGDWSGAGAADIGPGSGTDSFHRELGGQILVRRSQATYEARDGKPGGSYASLMVIFIDPATAALRADYFDTGGHVIHYALVPGSDPRVVRFESDRSATAPSFRLTYTDAADDKTMRVEFELAPPGSSTFSTTIAQGVETRVAR